MANILIQAPDAGLNSLMPDNMLDPRGAAEGSRNVLYERGFLRTAFGFAKLDLTTTGLNSGEKVLDIFPFNELDGYSHLMAITNSKIYENDKNNNTWSDRTQSGFSFLANIDRPTSSTVIAHTDAITLNGVVGSTNWYHHLIITDGGNSDIQRWAGRYEVDTANLLGGGGYHDGTTHRAKQVVQYLSRLMLISPLAYSSTAKTWNDNNQRIQYPQVGKLETWTGTGSGFADLLDTGGTNIRGALLGGQLVVYQNQGIWTIRSVGGTNVIDPYPYIPDLGLLAPHLLCVKNNIHYFMGTDYNIYAYYGGTSREAVGDKIRDFLEAEISKTYDYRCWMTMDSKEKRLWIFIVAEGNAYITKAYGLDLRTGAWMIRDFTDLFDGASSGITAVSLVGSQSYIVGETYKSALDLISLYDASSSSAADTTESSDITLRYGDVLRGETTSNVVDWSVLAEAGDDLDFTDVEFSRGGLFFCYSTGACPTGWFCQTATCGTAYSGAIIRIDDGSDSANMKIGSRYYTLGDISSVDSGGTDWTVKVSLEPKDTTGNACADASTDIPALNSIGSDCSATLFCPSGKIYRQILSEVLTDEIIHIGDASGFVYRFDDTLAEEDDVKIMNEHITPTYDLQMPDVHKRWPGINIIAKTETLSNIMVYYDIDDAGWVLAGTLNLSDEYEEYPLYINKTGKRIKFKFLSSGGKWKIREYQLMEPEVQDDR